MDEAKRAVLKATLTVVAERLEATGDRNDAAFAALIYGAMGSWLAGISVEFMHECAPSWERMVKQIALINASPNN